MRTYPNKIVGPIRPSVIGPLLQD